uniref:Uncharacterized protein n=1 Tax=Cacopsylla melanoneura TaxID=428564 RepID=A0A8D9AL69_9HEMI
MYVYESVTYANRKKFIDSNSPQPCVLMSYIKHICIYIFMYHSYRLYTGSFQSVPIGNYRKNGPQDINHNFLLSFIMSHPMYSFVRSPILLLVTYYTTYGSDVMGFSFLPFFLLFF